jgi:hypothetical protein
MRQQCVFCAQLVFHFFASHRVGSKRQASKEHLCHKYIRLGQEAGEGLLGFGKTTCSDDSTGRREGPQQEQAAGSQGVRGVWGLGACSQGNKVVHAHMKLFDEFILSARHNDARA